MKMIQITVVEYFLCAKFYNKYLICIFSFNFHNNPERVRYFYAYFYIWRDQERRLCLNSTK